MREVITSNQNKHVKHVKSLHAKKYRDNLGQYVIEGYKLIDEALQYQKPFDFVMLSNAAYNDPKGQNLIQRFQEMSIPVFITEDRIFKEISEMDAPQGVLAVMNKQEEDIGKVLDSSQFNIIILDEVRDPGNVGTIIRTADACGMSAVVLSKGCVDLYNGKTIRATMGSMFHIPVITEVDIMNLIIKLKSMGASVLGADPHSSVTCIEADKSPRTAIIVGNESNGLRDEVKAATTQNITIPMPGKAESLNAGIAAAILMYEFAVRKKI